MEPFPPKPPSPFDPEGGNFITVTPPLEYSGTRVFSFTCSPGGVALTSNELRLLAAHPAEGGSEQAQQISYLVQRLLRDAAVEKNAFAELQTSIAQIRLRRDARVATLLGQPRESTASGSTNGGVWIAALNEKVAAVERDAAVEERAEVAAIERAQIRSQMAEVQVAACAAAAHNAAQELRVARQEGAEAAVAFAAAAENAAFATAAAESGAADDMESALAAVAAGAGTDTTSSRAFGDGTAGSHWQTTSTRAAPMPSPDGGSSWAAPPFPAAATSGSGRVQLPPRRRSSRSGTPVQRSAAALDKASKSALVEAPTPEAPTVVASHVPNADVAAAAAGSGGVPNTEILIAAPSSSKAASAGLAQGEAKKKATPSLSTTAAALPESQRFQHHIGSISDAELALEAPPLINSSSRKDSDGAGSVTAAADGGDHESEAQRAMRGFTSLRLRAKNGDAAAASKLGLALFCGVGQGGGEGVGLGGGSAAAVAHPNVAKAVVYWTKAAKAGDVSAQCSLGVCYMLGPSGSSGGSEEAGENGSSTASNNAAAAVPYKPEGAVKWWTRAAMAGCSAAMHNLGLLCARGYSARLAAGKNGGDGHSNESESHANGSGSGGGATTSATSTAPAIVNGDVLPNPRAAFEWYSRAAALGHREAMNNLGAALCSGDTGDDDDDDNNKLSGASGRGSPGSGGSGGGSLIGSLKGRDPAGAASWYEKAANLGSAEAANNLGLLLWSGDGVPADPARAVALWNTAAASGNPEAMCSLGVAYMTGAPGMASDKAAAVAWWQKAAQNGNANAQYNLSKAYQHGQGCKRSPPTAMKWCAAAAAQGHAQAAAALAEHERRRQRAALAKQQQQAAAAVANAAGAAAGANSSATAAEINPQSSAAGERTSAPQPEGAAAAEPNATKELKEGKQASSPPVNIQESNTGAAANAGDGTDSGGQGAATKSGQRSSPGPLRQMLRRPGAMNNPDGLLEDYSNQQLSSEPSASPSGPRPTPVSSTAGSANGSVARPGPPGFPRSNSLASTRHRSASSTTAQSATASPLVNSRRSMTPTRRFPSTGSSSVNGAASLSSPLNSLPRRPLRSRSQTPGSTGPSVIVDPAAAAASTTGAYSSSSSHRGRSNSAGRTLVTPSPRTRSPVIRRGVSSGGAGALSSSSARGRSPSPAASAGRQSMAGSAVATAGSATRSSFSNGYAGVSGASGGLPNRGRSMPLASAKPVTPRARSNSPASNRFANKAALDHRRLVRRSPSQAPELEGSGDTSTAAASRATSSGVAASSSGSATPGASPPLRRPVRHSLSQGMRPALASPSSLQQRGSTEAAAAQRSTPSGSTARPARESALEALAKNGADAPANSPGNWDGLVTYSAYAALVPGSSP